MRAAINRSAEHQALKGGHNRMARDDWSRRAEELPLLDEESTRFPPSKKMKRKKGKAKERCRSNPNGHTHEWMKDEEEIPVLEYSLVTEKYGPDLAALLGEKTWTRRRETQVGTTTQLYRLCVHCGKTQIKRHGKWKGPSWYDSFRHKFRNRLY